MCQLVAYKRLKTMKKYNGNSRLKKSSRSLTKGPNYRALNGKNLVDMEDRLQC